MPHEDYIDPIANDGPRFRSNAPVSELTERVTRAIEASDVSSAPPVAETADGVTHRTKPAPTKPNGAQVARHRLGKSTDRAGRGRDKHGRTPRIAETQESAAPGKSTKMLSLQPTHQLDAVSGATPTGCARAHPPAS